MSKPSTVPLWDTNETHTTTTTGGHITDGFVTDEVPASDELNYWMNLVGQWEDWLDGLWGADGSLTMDSGADITLSGDGNVLVTGSGLVESTTGFTGAASGVAPFPAGVSIGASGDLKHAGPWQMDLNFYPDAGVTNVTTGTLSITSSGSTWLWKGLILPLRVGDRITKIEFWASTKTGSITTTLKKRVTATQTLSPIDSHAFAATGAGNYAYTLVTPVTISGNEQWWIELNGANTGEVIEGLTVYWTHP